MPHDEGDVPPGLPPRTRRERLVQVLLGLLVVAMGAMWIYAWVFAPRGDPDRLEDQSWTDEAEARCAISREAVDAVRPGVTDAADRVADIRAVTEVLTLLVEDLRAAPPTQPDDADVVGRGLDDYETYLQDRREFAEALAEDPTSRFLVTSRDGRQLTTVLDRFADVNGMQSCMTPADVT